jgi:uncharacterized membrane protein
MPYEWTEPKTAIRPDTPRAELHLWPYRSLPNRGFVVFIGVTAVMFTFPLAQVLGTPVLWGILPFMLIVVAALWSGLRRNQADGIVLEELRLWPDRVTLTRTGPRRAHHFWEANPHWVSVMLYPTGGPIENYLTLKGAGREVEIGAFLTEDERLKLRHEIQTALADLR